MLKKKPLPPIGPSMSAFLITGLPRSKTAWLSVVASTVRDSICYHEPVKRHKSWECCFDLWASKDYEHTGIADAHLGFHLDAIRERVNPRILIIRRDIEHVKASVAALGGPQTNYVDLLAHALDRHITAEGLAWVSFDGLTHIDIVGRCLNFLMPGCTIDERKIREMIDLNVRVDMDVVWDFALANRENADLILGANVMAGLALVQ